MFVGRERELATLERLYQLGSFQFPVVYGRRRVGKTTLINKFIGRKPVVFFTAVENDERTNLRNLSRALFLFEYPDRNPDSAPLFADFQTAFEFVFTLAREKQLVFVIDEYPYLAKANPSVSSILQALIDREQASSKLFLVLCGSSLSFMKEQVLSEKSPLYGRRTAQIEVKPFDFFDSMAFFPHRDPIEVAQIYGMVGGVPLYLLQFSGNGSLHELTETAMLDPSSILYEEPINLLLQEVQKASRYNAIVGAIAEGRAQNNEIATAVGITSAELAYYLKELERIGLVTRDVPVVKSNRGALYRLSDNLFRFWYRFVLPYRSAIERGMKGRAWQAIENSLSEYMGPVFEDICVQWLWRQAITGELEVDFDDIGRWWGNDPRLRQEAEIDIVAAEGKRVVLAGECKWRNEKFPLTELKKLEHRVSLVGELADVRLYGFSKTGFSEACYEWARAEGRVRLITFADMVA
ncbi:ATP-binding protein [Adlercreutzia sp. ZJ141]|uniref:ATP-binding protein n=1 Tax=Adlercreutzia sp. ZJ141 TaxID=2709406 RepID=UPI0013EB2D6A|nr:ATP-binding protein [Adlercreutzia sp. ZJ141]